MTERWLAAAVVAAAMIEGGDAWAQRVFARVDTALFEIHTSPGRLGTIVGATPLPACGPPPYYGSGRTWPVLHGRYLAWEREHGLCLFDVLAGRLRQFDVPDAFAGIVAASDSTFAVVMARGPSLFILGDPDGPIVSMTIPRTQPLKPFATQPWSYAIAPVGRRLVVVQGDDFVPTPSGPALVTTVSLSTGAIERETTVAAPLAWNAFTDRTGDYVLAIAGDAVYRSGIADGAYLARTTDGAIVATVPGVIPNREVLAAPNDGRQRLLWHEDSGQVIGLTALAAGPLAIPLLTDIGAYDLPRAKVPPPPLYLSSVSYRLWVDPGTRRFLALETEAHTQSYHGGPCVRSTLTAAELTSGAIRSANMQATVGQLLCGWSNSFFLVPTPERPRGFSADVRRGRVTLTWAPVAGATHYVLEAGTAPGLANLATLAVAGTSIPDAAVPPGVYYVRVRAVGVGGQGIRSADLAVTVP